MLFDDINEVRLMGNLTQEPNLKFTTNGNQVLTLSIATNRSYKKGDAWEDKVTYHNIEAWGNLATKVGERVKKGTRVYIEGRLEIDSWDGDDGNKRYRAKIIAQNIILIDRYIDPRDNTAQVEPEPEPEATQGSAEDFEKWMDGHDQQGAS